MIIKTKLSIGVFAVIPLIATVPAQAATYSGANGDITYIQKQGQQRILLSMTHEGSHKQVLDRNVQSMAWSPDGRRLAYLVGGSGCASQLRIMHYASKRVQTVARGGCIVGDIAWAPDGTQLALTRAKGTARAIMTITPAEGFERAVTGWKQGVAYKNASWSPDATRLVYEQHTPQQSSLVVHRLSSHASRILTELSDAGVDAKASWSPNGKKILYQDSGNEVYTIWPDGSHRAVISDGDSYDASWSPDGSRIVFLEDFSGEGFSISMSDGSVKHFDMSNKGYLAARSPVWSPDATNLLLLVDTRNGNRLVQVDVKTMQSRVLATDLAGTVGWQSLQSSRP